MAHHSPTVTLVSAALASALLPLAGCVSSTDNPGSAWTTEVVALARLDRDTLPDLLTATSVWDQAGPQPGYLSARLHLRTAAGLLGTPQRTDTCLDPEALALGDIDGDGRLDVAVACGAATGSAYEVVVHLQSTFTPGSFGPPVSLSTGSARPTAIRLADLDGDGRLDLVVGASTGTGLLLFFQQPAPATPGSFAAAVTLEVGSAPVAVAVGDLTGDGRLDLVATTADGRAVVLLHDTAPGTYLPGVSYPAGLYPVAIEIADLDGDGHPDLLMADRSGALLVMRQAGGGTFDPVVAHDVFDQETRALAVADLDGDGRLDLVVASAGPPGWPGSVAVFYQAPYPVPPGTLLAPRLYTGYQGPLSVAVADIDGDGLPDLVIADGLASIRFQVPGGGFEPPVWLRQ
jgi:hypothetical protein